MHANEQPLYPATFYHPTEDPKVVKDAQEEKLLGSGWQRAYIHRDFPAFVFHPKKGEQLVNNQEELDALGKGWTRDKAEADEARNKGSKGDEAKGE